MQPAETRSPSRLLVGLALLAVVVAALIGIQVFRALYGLIFIPDAPLPDSRTLIQHRNISHGVDEWTFTVPVNPCEVVGFYESQNSTCQVQGNLCTDGVFNDPGYPLEEIAQCVGTDTFSIYGLRWDVSIYNQMINGQITTSFDIRRDMLWSGPAPRATSTPLP